jgi:hypothetical protein
MIQIEINITIDENDGNKMRLDFNKLTREDANPLEKKFGKVLEKFLISITKDILIDKGAKLGLDEKIKPYRHKQPDTGEPGKRL